MGTPPPPKTFLSSSPSSSAALFLYIFSFYFRSTRGASNSTTARCRSHSRKTAEGLQHTADDSNFSPISACARTCLYCHLHPPGRPCNTVDGPLTNNQKRELNGIQNHDAPNFVTKDSIIYILVENVRLTASCVSRFSWVFSLFCDPLVVQEVEKGSQMKVSDSRTA